MTAGIERRIVPTYSGHCKGHKHTACEARMANGQELLVCMCRCHDEGERRPVAAEPPPPPASSADISAVMAWAGRRGGKKGGLARAKALSPEQRTAQARKAALARWGNR